MKTAIAVLLICVVWAAETEAAPKTAFVINNMGETLSLINLEDGTVDNNVVRLGLVPNWATVSEGMVYVVNSMSDDIYIIDIETNLIVDSILLPEGSNPWAIEFLNDSIAYVSAFLMNSVFSIDVKNRVILDTIPVGLSPQGLYITGNKIFVAITAFDPTTWTWGDGMVYVIDAGTNSVIDSTAVGTNPQSLAMDTDGELYVICTGNYGAIEGMVYKLDSGTYEILDSLRTGGTPASISISSSGIAWVGAGGWGDNGYVYLIDTNTDSVLRGSDNPILVGRGVMGLAYDGGGNCYVSSFASDKVYKVDKMGNVL
ncbi:YncE family protein, partial [candidate division WOR-3 bacterium]|nr:YncE family protein [candidate division WOR-3 bacterium]